MPEVSVIMNCHNGEQYLREAIESVYAQTFDDWEIIFWDNASTDSSADIAKSYDDKLRYFRNETKTSLGAARNLAFQETRGTHIAFLDDDDLWLPEKLEKQVALLDKNPKLGLVFSNSQYFYDNKDRYTRFELTPPQRGNIFGSLLSYNFISTVDMMYRKKALADKTPPYDDSFTMVIDYFLSLQVAYQWPVDYCDRILSKYRLNPGSESQKRFYLIAREQLQMIDKLKHLFPDITTRYPEQLDSLKASSHFQLGIESWTLGDIPAARRHFSPYKGLSKKCFLAYILTFLFPFKIREKTFQKLRKVLTSARTTLTSKPATNI